MMVRSAGRPDTSQRAAAPQGPGPDRAVAHAARWVRDGRRLEMQGLADELGVSRVTLFRQAGSREELLSKALWVLTEATLGDGLATLGGRAAEGVAALALHRPALQRDRVTSTGAAPVAG